jgi:hypothetical protein
MRDNLTNLAPSFFPSAIIEPPKIVQRATKEGGNPVTRQEVWGRRSPSFALASIWSKYFRCATLQSSRKTAAGCAGWLVMGIGNCVLFGMKSMSRRQSSEHGELFPRPRKSRFLTSDKAAKICFSCGSVFRYFEHISMNNSYSSSGSMEGLSLLASYVATLWLEPRIFVLKAPFQPGSAFLKLLYFLVSETLAYSEFKIHVQEISLNKLIKITISWVRYYQLRGKGWEISLRIA